MTARDGSGPATARPAASDGSRLQLLDALLLAACGIALALALLPCWRYILDDAYISFRYARNLLEGHGLTFNPGDHVEGYSNFLWVLVSALLQALFGREQILLAAKVAGSLLAAGTVTVTYLTARRLFGRPLAAAAPALLLATNAGFAANSVNGLETALLSFLVALAFYVRLGDRPRMDAPFAIVLILISWTRPEGYYLSAVLLLAHLVFRVSPRRIVRMAAIYAVGVAPVLLWKLLYYGSVIPNTYYAKPPSLARGVLYLGDFLVEGGMLDSLALPLVAAVVGIVVLPSGRGWYLTFFVTLWSAVVVSGGDWMIGWRFVVPSLSLLFLAVGSAIARIPAALSRGGRAVGRFVASLAFVLIFIALSKPSAAIENDCAAYGEGQTRAHLAIARWLAETGRPGDAVALMDIGMIGYYSGLRVIDIAGLVDTHIGHSPGRVLKKVYDPAYVLDQKPEFIVLVGQMPMGPSHALEATNLWFLDRRLAAHPGFLEQYGYVFSCHAPFEGFLHLFRRRPTARAFGGSAALPQPASSRTPRSRRSTSSGRAPSSTEQKAMRRYRSPTAMRPVSW